MLRGDFPIWFVIGTRKIANDTDVQGIKWVSIPFDTVIAGRIHRCTGDGATDVGGRIIPMLRVDFWSDCLTNLTTCQGVKHIQSFVYKDQNNATCCVFLVLSRDSQ